MPCTGSAGNGACLPVMTTFGKKRKKMTLPRKIRQILTWPLWGGSFSLSPVEKCCLDLVCSELPGDQKAILKRQIENILRIQHWVKGRMTHISLDPTLKVEPFPNVPEEHCLAEIQYLVKEKKKKVFITTFRGYLKTIEGAIPSDTALLNETSVRLNPKVQPKTAEGLDRIEHGRHFEENRTRR